MFLKRLRAKVERENLWFFLLLLLSEEESHAYVLRRKVQERFGFWSGQVTAYRVLYALEQEGCVVGEKRDGRRVYYRVTEKGRKLIVDATAYFSELSRRGREVGVRNE